MTEDDIAWAKQLGPAYRLKQVTNLLGRSEREVLADSALLRLDSPAGEPQYPKFQFTTGKRREAVRGVVRTLGDAVASSWTTASWLTSPQSALSGRTPLEAIDDGDTITVLDRARRLAVALRH